MNTDSMPGIDFIRAVVLNVPFGDNLPVDERGNLSPAIIEFLLWNRLVPLFYHRVKQQKFEDRLSAASLVRLKGAQQKSLLYHLRKEVVLQEIIVLLQLKNIHPFVLKGMALAYSVYEHPALRPMMDIDLLFLPGEAEKARDLLMKHGAREIYAQESEHTMGLWQHIPPLRYKGVMLELHTHIQSQYEKGYLPLEQLIVNPQTIQIGKTLCRTFQPAIQLYHLLVHLHKHVESHYSRLIWMADMHYLVMRLREEINAALLTQLIQNAGMEELLPDYAGILKALFATDFPMPVPAAGEDKIHGYLALCRRIVPNDHQLGTLRMMRQLKGFGPRIRFILGKLFPSVRYVQIRFGITGRWRALLYYPVIYAGYVRKVVRFMMRDST